MKTYVYEQDGALSAMGKKESDIRQILKEVASGTDTSTLVVAVYFISAPRTFRGAYWRNWKEPRQFAEVKKTWNIAGQFPLPGDLPRKYKLIRLLFGQYDNTRPFTESMLNYKLKFSSMDVLIAYLFAHELAHFRTRHLRQEPGGGELSADNWAINRAREIGRPVEARRILNKKHPTPLQLLPTTLPTSNPTLLNSLCRELANLSPDDLLKLKERCIEREFELKYKAMIQEDHELADQRLRNYARGTRHVITRTNSEFRNLRGLCATVLGQVRRNADRVLIRAGQTRVLYPIDWLTPIIEPPRYMQKASSDAKAKRRK